MGLGKRKAATRITCMHACMHAQYACMYIIMQNNVREMSELYYLPVAGSSEVALHKFLLAGYDQTVR